ncbi:hypothetical protein E4U17_000883 [Claviceps sp. LM77 group G4]|nr:hypothetical protein E4U17_000883 [Claviceps sp. LM77 group G4]KAG6071572.1 hypothetical protein E4U33_003622 [Claviceps sp. LM78 group G4]KAG6075979.1 hypothetical protein E4U16_003048 [Claviceps sp. LM84 group G4]
MQQSSPRLVVSEGLGWSLQSRSLALRVYVKANAELQRIELCTTYLPGVRSPLTDVSQTAEDLGV